MRTVLVGAVESTAVALRTMAEAGSPFNALVTLPPERLHQHSDSSDLGPTANELGTPVILTGNINEPETIQAIATFEPDVIFVIGWSQICKREFRDLARNGTIGYHPSALPENRGRAVIPWTILQGSTRTGSTLFWMDDGMDSGDIVYQELIPLEPRETATTLYAKHMRALKSMLIRFEQTDPDRLPRDSQNHTRATYCSQRIPEDGRIDWSRSAEEIDKLVRATTDPYPGAFSTLDGKELAIWESEPIDVPYLGVPGQIQLVREDGPVVQCGNRSHLLIRRARFRDDQGSAIGALRRQTRLGIT